MTSISGYLKKSVFLMTLIVLPFVAGSAYADHGGGGGGHGGGGGGGMHGGGGGWNGGGGHWNGGGGNWRGGDGGGWGDRGGWGGGYGGYGGYGYGIGVPFFYGDYNYDSYPGYNNSYYDQGDSPYYYDNGGDDGMQFDVGY